MKKIKRVFSLLLILTIVASVIPTPVKAMTIRKVTSVKVKEKKAQIKNFKVGKKWRYVKYKYLQLSWKKVTGVSGYEVYRYGEASKQWYKVKTTSKKVTSYVIPEVEKGMKVRLKVRAYKNTDSGKIYSEFSSVKSFKGKRNYEIEGKLKHGKYWKKDKIWDIKNPKAGNYRFVSEYAFVIQNKYRTEKGVAPLKWNNDIYEMAKIRSKELYKNFSHTRPNGENCGTVMLEYIRKTNRIDLTKMIAAYGCGENIASGQSTAKEAMIDWKKSKGHYHNLLANEYNFGAISLYYKNGNSQWASLLVLPYNPTSGRCKRIDEMFNN